MAYTCHTLLPEALEKWPVDLFASLLPRHLEIIYEINRRFLEEVRARFPGDDARIARMSIIEEQPVRQIRMAHLATIGSRVVNGVAELQSRLLREVILKDFAEMWPEKFQNKTNGVTPRRFMRLANPALSQLITSKIGDGWLTDLEQLARLEQYADEPRFQAAWRDVKQQNKQRLADAPPADVRRRRECRFHVRHHGQTTPRVQTPAAQGAAHYLALSPRQDESPDVTDAADLRLRRQGGPRLFPGQTDHQADPQPGPRDQRRSGGAMVD